MFKNFKMTNTQAFQLDISILVSSTIRGVSKLYSSHFTVPNQNQNQNQLMFFIVNFYRSHAYNDFNPIIELDKREGLWSIGSIGLKMAVNS